MNEEIDPLSQSTSSSSTRKKKSKKKKKSKREERPTSSPRAQDDTEDPVAKNDAVITPRHFAESKTNPPAQEGFFENLMEEGRALHIITSHHDLHHNHHIIQRTFASDDVFFSDDPKEISGGGIQEEKAEERFEDEMETTVDLVSPNIAPMPLEWGRTQMRQEPEQQHGGGAPARPLSRPGAFAMHPGDPNHTNTEPRRTLSRSNFSAFTAADHEENDDHQTYPQREYSLASPQQLSSRSNNNTSMTAFTTIGSLPSHLETPIIATVVPQNEEHVPPPATSYDPASGLLPSQSPLDILLKDSRIRIVIVIFLLLFIGLLGSVIALVVRSNDGQTVSVPVLEAYDTPGTSSSSPVPFPTPAPPHPTMQSNLPTLALTTSPTTSNQRVVDVLVGSTFDNGNALLNDTTPQYMALQKLLSDPLVNNYSDARLLQRYTMETFHSILLLAGNSHWVDMDFSDECALSFITCNVFGTITKLVFRWYGVAGTIPEELGLLSSLGVLDLMGNVLSGTIPLSLTRLTKLGILSLGWNRLSGAIPSGLSGLGRLSELSLHNNFLSGTIPTEVGLLTTLTSFIAYDNQLIGSIPDKIWSITSLREIVLNMNDLTGTVSKAIGHATRLFHLEMGTNLLTGSFPTELGLMTNLEYLDLEDNELTGPLPSVALLSLSELRLLDLSRNNFNSSIPVEISLLTGLDQSLCLQGNALSGTIPTELGRLRHLAHDFDLGANMLTGTIPSELGWLTSLEKTFSLADNSLHGALPSELGHLTSLSSLELENIPRLTGEIPSEIGQLTELESFAAFNNDLSGSVPQEICNLLSSHDLEEIKVDCDLICFCCHQFCY